MPNTTNIENKENVTDALEALRKHKEKIFGDPSDARKEKLPLLNTLDEYGEVFDRYNLTARVQMLWKACIDLDYSGMWLWFNCLEALLQWIINSNDCGHDCEQCPYNNDFCVRNADNLFVLGYLAIEVNRTLRNPMMWLLAMFDCKYRLWLKRSISILKENGYNY